MPAGDIYFASRTVNERTSNGSTFTTTESQLDGITAPLKNGKRYRIVWLVNLSSSAAGDTVSLRIRVDTAVGASIRSVNVALPAASTVYTYRVEEDFTATATGDKTFIGSGQRTAGSGTITPTANSSSGIARMYIEQVPA